MDIHPIVTDHGLLVGLEDDDHLQYIKDTEFTQDSGFLVGTGSGTFQEETGSTARDSLGLGAGDAVTFDNITTSKVRFDTNGTVGAPVLTWSSDNDTGLYHSAADTLDFTTGGTKRFSITNTAVTSTVDGNFPKIVIDSDLTLDDSIISDAGTITLRPSGLGMGKGLAISDNGSNVLIESVGGDPGDALHLKSNVSPFAIEAGGGTPRFSVTGDFNPSAADTYDLGGAVAQWEDLHLNGTANIDTMVITGGSITDGSGAISFGDENLTTSGTITAGTLTVGSGSITDTSGTISFGNEDLSTTGDIVADYLALGGAAIDSKYVANIVETFTSGPTAATNRFGVWCETYPTYTGRGTSGYEGAGHFLAQDNAVITTGKSAFDPNIVGLHGAGGRSGVTPADYQEANGTLSVMGLFFQTADSGKYSASGQTSENICILVENNSNPEFDNGGVAATINNYGLKTDLNINLTKTNAGVLTVSSYGVYLDIVDSTGADATSTSYGVYLAAMSGADTQYFLYDNVGVDSVLQGSVRIGDTTAPTDALEVNGITNLGDGGTTNYAEFDATGDVIFKGSSGLAYASMYTNAAIAVTLTNQNQWYEIDAAQAWTTGKVHNCTFSDPKMTVTNAGTYLITYTVSASVDANSQEIEFGIMIDSTNTDGPAHGAAGVQNEGRGHRVYSTLNDEGHQSGVAIIQLAASKTVSLAARNITSADDTLSIGHGNMTVVQIAGGSA